MGKPRQQFVSAGLFILSLALFPTFAQETLWDQYANAGRAALEERRFAEAEKHLRAALAEAEGFGSSDPRLITSLEALLDLYRRQGLKAPQEPPMKRLLEVREGQLGYAHPDLVPDLMNLAWLYQERGKPGEALPLLTRALEIREAALGPNHPDTIQAVIDVGRTHLELRQFAQAEEMFRRSLLVHENNPEGDVEAITQDLRNLASVYARQGLRDEAEALDRQAREGQNSASGESAEEAMEAAWQTGEFYAAKWRFGEAEPLLLRAIEIEEKVLGARAPNLIFRYQEMVRIYRLQGREEEAQAFVQRALAIAAKPGKTEPAGATGIDTELKILNSAALYMDERRFAEAEKLYQEALEISRNTDGQEYPMRVSILESLGSAVCAQGDLDRALPFLRKAIAIAEKAEGADHPRVASCLLSLARCYCRLDRDAEGEAVLKQAIQILDKPRPQIPFEIFNVLEFYARLLRATGREAQAKQVDARLQELQQKFAQPNPEP